MSDLQDLIARVEAGEGRTLASLSKHEKAWLKRRFCAWCDARCTATRCQALYDKCDMDRQRAVWLRSYKPRAAVLRAREAGRA